MLSCKSSVCFIALVFTVSSVIEISNCLSLLHGTPKAGRRREELDDKGRVVLEWELNDDQTEITFDLWAETTGFVGFGISPQGGMVGADIFVAGVGQDAVPYSSDRFAPANGFPREDKHADWTLLNASENGTTTYLKFSRALYTCDEDEDYPITNGTNRVIWAMGMTDNLEQHLADNRGTRSISLLTVPAADFDEEDFQTWTGVVNMTMPKEDTSYWCSIHVGPELNQTHYIVAFDALLPNELAFQHTHHFILYDCILPDNETVYETFHNLSVSNGFNGVSCLENIMPVQYCGSRVLYTWAKGGKRMVFPEDVAYPIGEEGGNKTRYFLLQTHYDNPREFDNLTFATGVQIFYSNKSRIHEAAQMVVTDSSSIVTLVPPNTAEFVVNAHCSSECTADRLDPEGITVFNVLLHSHLSGRKLKLRHFRNGTELPWIDYDDHYDFDYQQNKPLSEHVKVLPGDHLTYECTYSSIWNNGSIVTGGMTTKNEMCEAFIWYYPKNTNKLVTCGSLYNYNQSYADFGITKWNETENGGPNTFAYYILEPESLEGEFEDSISHKFNWTDEFKNSLEKKRRFGKHEMVCGGTSGEYLQGFVSYPESFEEYKPKDFCARQSDSSSGRRTSFAAGVSGVLLSLGLAVLIK